MISDAKFEYAVTFVLSHEGGYSDQAEDRGGSTKYGISQAQYPNLDIPNLTEEDAKAIYYRDFWNHQRYEDIADLLVAAKVFDLSVNMGPHEAILILQKALNVLVANTSNISEDGILGSGTINAVNTTDCTALLNQIKILATEYYTNIVTNHPSELKFLAGWIRRAYA